MKLPLEGAFTVSEEESTEASGVVADTEAVFAGSEGALTVSERVFTDSEGVFTEPKEEFGESEGVFTDIEGEFADAGMAQPGVDSDVGWQKTCGVSPKSKKGDTARASVSERANFLSLLKSI